MPRTTPFIVASVLALAVVGWTSFQILDGLALATERRTEDLSVPERLRVELDSGDLTLERGVPGRLRLHTEVRSGLADGVVHRSLDDGELRLDGDCPAVAGWCSVRFVLEVPPGIPVTARTGSGDVEADGVDAPLLDLRSGSGEVDAERLRVDEVVLDTGSGDVSMSAVEAPRRIDAESGSGEVDLSLPDVAFSVEAETGSGEEDVNVKTDPDSPRKVRVKTGSGDLSITAP